MRHLFLSCGVALGFASLTACGQGTSNAGAPTDVQSSEAQSSKMVEPDETARSIYGARLRARLIDASGTKIGDILAWQGMNGVLIEISATSLTPGGHGLHLHSVGDCSDIGAFKASGGHVGEDVGPHGFLHPGGAHGGDLPNLYVAKDGAARVDIFTMLVSLDDLRDADGAALIIHAIRDDYQTPPIGGAGPRIACAAFNHNP